MKLLKKIIDWPNRILYSFIECLFSIREKREYSIFIFYDLVFFINSHAHTVDSVVIHYLRFISDCVSHDDAKKKINYRRSTRKKSLNCDSIEMICFVYCFYALKSFDFFMVSNKCRSFCPVLESLFFLFVFSWLHPVISAKFKHFSCSF